MAKKTILSPEQDVAATPTKNVWVQANAGTGKTSVLTQRLLRILFRTTDCLSSGILCLTYTNAGAGEMRNRILRALREWAMADDSDLIEMLDGYFQKLPREENMRESLSRLRMYRNCLVHAEYTDIIITPIELKNCIDYICKMEK